MFSPARDPFDASFSCSCLVVFPAGPELRVVLALEEVVAVVVLVVVVVASAVVVVAVVEISLSPVFEYALLNSFLAGPVLRVVVALEEEVVIVEVVVVVVVAAVVVVVVVEISLSPIFEYAFLSSFEWSLAPRVVSHSNETIT